MKTTGQIKSTHICANFTFCTQNLKTTRMPIILVQWIDEQILAYIVNSTSQEKNDTCETDKPHNDSTEWKYPRW